MGLFGWGKKDKEKEKSVQQSPAAVTPAAAPKAAEAAPAPQPDEKYYATGKFPGGFFKRETKPSDYEVLISRLIDRALRPLFPDDYHAETIVQVTLLSGNKEEAPDCLAALAASAAITVSDIPFHGPISEVRVAMIGDEYVINPTFAQMEDARLELMVAASMKDICMVEGECKEVSEAEMLGALKAAHEAIKIQCQAQIELAERVNKEKRVYHRPYFESSTYRFLQ